MAAGSMNDYAEFQVTQRDFQAALGLALTTMNWVKAHEIVKRQFDALVELDDWLKGKIG